MRQAAKIVERYRGQAMSDLANSRFSFRKAARHLHAAGARQRSPAPRQGAQGAIEIHLLPHRCATAGGRVTEHQRIEAQGASGTPAGLTIEISLQRVPEGPQAVTLQQNVIPTGRQGRAAFRADGGEEGAAFLAVEQRRQMRRLAVFGRQQVEHLGSRPCRAGYAPQAPLPRPLLLDLSIRPARQLGDRVFVALDAQGQLANRPTRRSHDARQQRAREAVSGIEDDKRLGHIGQGAPRRRLHRHQLEMQLCAERRLNAILHPCVPVVVRSPDR